MPLATASTTLEVHGGFWSAAEEKLASSGELGNEVYDAQSIRGIATPHVKTEGADDAVGRQGYDQVQQEEISTFDSHDPFASVAAQPFPAQTEPEALTNIAYTPFQSQPQAQSTPPTTPSTPQGPPVSFPPRTSSFSQGQATIPAVGDHKSNTGLGVVESEGDCKMVFSEFQRTQAMAHRRRAMANTAAITEYEADLTSRDRDRQKKAIKELLNGKVRNDWSWDWPPVEVGNPAATNGAVDKTPNVQDGDQNASSENGDGNAADEESEVEGQTWVERDEWESNDTVSDDGKAYDLPSGETFIENDDAGVVHANPSHLSEADRRKARRTKRLLKEMSENDGMRCFVHRRNAWTCARHVRRPPQAALSEMSGKKDKRSRKGSFSSPILSRITSRISNHDSTPNSPTKITLSRLPTQESQAVVSPTFHQSSSQASPTSTSFGSLAQPMSNEDFIYNWLTLIPIGPPILPPETPMRKNINEKAYGHIYDKVIIQSQTPYCPINLAVVVKSCVEGWKRDGEWPPPEAAQQAERMGTGFSIARQETRRSERERKERRERMGQAIGEEGNGAVKKGGFRRGLQKLTSIVHGKRDSTTGVLHSDVASTGVAKESGSGDKGAP